MNYRVVEDAFPLTNLLSILPTTIDVAYTQAPTIVNNKETQENTTSKTICAAIALVNSNILFQRGTTR